MEDLENNSISHILNFQFNKSIKYFDNISSLAAI